MKILFLRHAEAEDLQTTDHDRALTSKGIKQARRMGSFLEAAGWKPDWALTSPLVRARQTADLVAAGAELPEPTVVDWLACGMTPESCFDGCERLPAAESGGTLLLVGHEPDFSTTIGAWIGREGAIASVRVKKASLTGLDVSSFSAGGACLEFLIPIRILNYAP